MQNGSTIKVWDLGVRLFHWGLVAAFAIAYLSGDDDEGGLASLHAWAGYVIIGLLAFRILWGLFGSKHARFTDFVYAPGRILAYLKDMFTGHPKRYLGHNPAGGLMVIVMIVMLSAVSWTGLKVYQSEGKGPLAAMGGTMTTMAIPEIIPSAIADDDDGGFGEREGGEGDEFWEEAHEVSVNIMLLLIVLHLAGVAASSLMHGENLPRAMVTGRKPRLKEE